MAETLQGWGKKGQGFRWKLLTSFCSIMWGLYYIFAEMCGIEYKQIYDIFMKYLLTKPEIFWSDFQFLPMTKIFFEHFFQLKLLKYVLIRT